MKSTCLFLSIAVSLVLLASSCKRETIVAETDKKVAEEEFYYEEAVFINSERKDTLCCLKIFLGTDSLVVYKSKQCNTKVMVSPNINENGGGFNIRYEYQEGLVAEKEFRFAGKAAELPQEFLLRGSSNAGSEMGMAFMVLKDRYTTLAHGFSDINRLEYIDKLFHDSASGNGADSFVFKQAYVSGGVCHEITTAL